jgi:hypothetical protein
MGKPNSPYTGQEKKIVEELIPMKTSKLIEEGSKAANSGDIERARLIDEEIEVRKGEP